MLVDYRQLNEKFDRVVSVGMFEHVGRNFYKKYFNKVYDFLNEDGVALIHTIGSVNPPRPPQPWITKYIEGGKRKIDADLLLKICQELKIEISDLSIKSDLNLANNISELLDDKLFDDLDILGPEVKDLANTNPKIGRALIRLGDILKKKDHELVNRKTKNKD